MEIKFIQENKLNGDVIYYTMIDQRFVPSSLKFNKDEAYEVYKRVKENGGLLVVTQVLETFETEQTP